jgi:hypothetical protein
MRYSIHLAYQLELNILDRCSITTISNYVWFIAVNSIIHAEIEIPIIVVNVVALITLYTQAAVHKDALHSIRICLKWCHSVVTQQDEAI